VFLAVRRNFSTLVAADSSGVLRWFPIRHYLHIPRGGFSLGFVLSPLGSFCKRREKFATGSHWFLGLSQTLIGSRRLDEEWTLGVNQEDCIGHGAHYTPGGLGSMILRGRILRRADFEVFTPAIFLQYAPDRWTFHDAHSIYFEILGRARVHGLTLFLHVVSVAHGPVTSDEKAASA